MAAVAGALERPEPESLERQVGNEGARRRREECMCMAWRERRTANPTRGLTQRRLQRAMPSQDVRSIRFSPHLGSHTNFRTHVFVDAMPLKAVGRSLRARASPLFFF